MNADSMFAQYTPTPAQKRRMNSLRNLARVLAREIQSATPAGPNQTLAIRHVEDALMRANKAILEAVRSLPEHLGEAHNWYDTALDQVPKHRVRTDRRKLIHVPDQNETRAVWKRLKPFF